MVRKTSLAFVACLVFGFAVPGKDFDKEVPSELQGTWTGRQISAAGPIEKQAALSTHVLTITGNGFTWNKFNGTVEDTGKLEVRSNQKPGQIDFVIKAKEELRKQGIFELKDGSLTLCLGEYGAERPKQFKAGDNTSVYIWTKKPKTK